MAELKFGIFDWIDKNSSLSLHDTYEQRLRMLEYADEAGFWCYHMAEHHSTPLGVAPSPNLFLAAAAQRTERLRLGPLVQLLPLYNPMRNIEEICFLDNLSGGRLELGIGRGISAAEIATYGIDPDEARARFDECFDILLMGLTTGNVSYHGRYYTIEDAPLHIEPLQRPYPPLWYPTSSADRIPWVAREGFHTLFGFTRTGLDVISDGIAQYKTEWAAHKDEDGRLNGHVKEPLLGATRHVYVADTEREAVEVARAAYNEFDANFVTRPASGPAMQSRRGDFETAVSWGGVIVGTPDSVRQQVQHFVDASGANYFVGTFAFGGLTTEQVLHSIKLFGDEVMPNVTSASSQVA